MKRVHPPIRTVLASPASPRFRLRQGMVPTLTEDAALWKAGRLSEMAATTRFFRPVRPARLRSTNPGLASRLARQVMVALGIW